MGNLCAYHALGIIEKVWILFLCFIRVSLESRLDSGQLIGMVWIIQGEFVFGLIEPAVLIHLLWMMPAFPTDGKTAAAIINESEVGDGAVRSHASAVGAAKLFYDVIKDSWAVCVDTVHINIAKLNAVFVAEARKNRMVSYRVHVDDVGHISYARAANRPAIGANRNIVVAAPRNNL